MLIVDISRVGARLRWDGEAFVRTRPGERLLFNPQLQPFGELAHYLPGIVRWVKDLEFGLSFEHPLSLSASDIMRIVKN